MEFDGNDLAGILGKLRDDIVSYYQRSADNPIIEEHLLAFIRCDKRISGVGMCMDPMLCCHFEDTRDHLKGNPAAEYNFLLITVIYQRSVIADEECSRIVHSEAHTDIKHIVQPAAGTYGKMIAPGYKIIKCPLGLFAYSLIACKKRSVKVREKYFFT